MGKRRRRRFSSSSSEEEYLRYKIKKLQRKLESHESRSPSRARANSRTKRRSSESSSDCSRSRSNSLDHGRPPLVPADDQHFVDCSSVINDTTPADDPLQLDEKVLNAMGTNFQKPPEYGEPLHDVLATHCDTVLKTGLSEDRMTEILNKYPVPENCLLAQPPKLNPEIKAAINEASRKRDERLIARQKEVGVALVAIGKAESVLLKYTEKDDATLSVIENLSDAVSVLAKIHHADSEYRRTSILSLSLNQNTLQPHFKEALADAPLDSFLFGEDLAERLKAAKALGRSVADLRPSISKPKTASNLNYSGPPRHKKYKAEYKPQRRSGPSKYQNKYHSQKWEERRERGEGQKRHAQRRTSK